MVRAGADIVVLDGLRGATGAAPGFLPASQVLGVEKEATPSTTPAEEVLGSFERGGSFWTSWIFWLSILGGASLLSLVIYFFFRRPHV